MKYAVDPHLDQIREKRDSEQEFSQIHPSMRRWHLFISREDACEFIISRAEHKVGLAAGELRKAQARLQKCLHKFYGS